MLPLSIIYISCCCVLMKKNRKNVGKCQSHVDNQSVNDIKIFRICTDYQTPMELLLLEHINIFVLHIYCYLSLFTLHSSNPEFTLRTLAILYIVINNKKSFLKKWCIVNRLHLILWHLDRLSGNNNMQAHTPYFKFPKIGLIKYPLNKQIVLRGILSNA